MRFILKMLKLESTLIFTVVQVATVTGIILISPDLPEVYKRATLSCYSAGTGRAWYHQEELQTTCSDKGCLPNSKIQLGYTFTADKDKAEVTISSLDRKRDGGLWKCSAGGEQIISLDVYSFPSGLSFTRGGTTEIDLGESQTILQCQTDGCTYPAPTVRWYFKDIAPSAPRTFYKDTGTQVTGGSCTSPEELYTSSLVLPLYTIWQDNIDKNVTLSCGIEYSNVSRNVYSQESKQIRYAVRVTEAVMQQNNQNITDILNVTAGVPVTLTCLTVTSRPPATIVWYLGSQSKGSGTIWNFTPIAADHNGTFYCQVYNTDQNQTVSSNKARLYVRVPIDSVQLRNGTSLTLNEGQLAVLVCETGACRPSAAINWMKNGIDIIDSPTGVTEINVGNDLFVSMGMLNYTGQRGDNRKSLTCRAYNGLGSGQISGNLTVTIYYPPGGPPEIEGQVNGSSFTVIANTSQSLTCRIIGGNPLANLSWICVGHIGISNTSGQTVTSEIILAVGINAQDQRCTCQTSHPAERNKEVFVLLQVNYPPFIQLQTSPYKVIENQTLSVTCQVSSNPPADQIFWFPSGDGSVPSNNLYFSSVSRNNKGTYNCTAKNTMMPTVGRQQIGMNTRQIEVDVLYPPSIQLLTSPYKVIESQPLNVTCQVSSNPPPNQIIWTPSGEGSVPSRLYFSSVSRNYKGTYSCTATNTMTPTAGGQQNGTDTSQIQVDVLYSPSIQWLTSPYKVIENQPLNVTCQVSSNPLPDQIFWSPSGEGSVPSRLYFNSVSRNKNGTYTCTATNTMTPTAGEQQTGTNTSQMHVDVLYPPSIHGLTSPYKVIENQSLSVTCQVSSNPPPNKIFWTPSGEGSVPSRLYFSSVSRNNKGTYSCTATNIMTPTTGLQQNGTSTSQIQVDVLYIAKITEFASKGNIYEIRENGTLVLYCRVDSNPSSEISLSFGDVLISTIQNAHELINNTAVGCLSAGKYICSATNSVMNGATVSAEVNLKVQCAPRLDYRKNISTEYYGALNDNVTLEVNIIAYPEPTDIMWYHRAAKTDIWQQIRNQHASSSGLYSSITVHLGNQGDFGDYLVNMTNSFGIYNDRIFHVIPESYPGIPTEFSVTERIHDSVTLEWIPGFWGGHTQYFIIQYRMYPDGTWIDTDQIQEDTKAQKQSFIVSGLQQKTTYEFQMYARNKLGQSQHTQVINTTTSEVIQTTPGFQVGPLAGGVGSGAVVAAICIILVILFIKRRNLRNKEEGTPLELDRRSENINNCGSVGLADNPIYVTSGPRFGPSISKSTTVDEDAAVVKKKAALAEDTSKLYARVDKTNKNGKKGAAEQKHGKTSRGDIYQNIDLGGKIANTDSEYENSRQTRTETSDENVYENPGAVASNNPLVNKDGLLYADLMLNPPTTKNGKVVIRGIENRTEYAAIAFGKRGEPLPDSDEDKVDGGENKKKDG